MVEEPAPELTIGEVFERVAAERPDAIAIRALDAAPLRYGELLRWSRSVSGRLANLPGRESTAVGCLLASGSAFAAALLGGSAGGMPLLVLDPAGPRRRAIELARTAGISLLLCEQQTAAAAAKLCEAIDARSLCLAREDVCDDLPPLPATDPAAPALYVPTSGSTGRPEIVVQSHRFVVHNVRWGIAALGLQPGDRYAMLALIGHHAANIGVLRPLFSGGTLIHIDSRRGSPSDLARFLAESESTVVHATPTAFRFLCTAGAVTGWPTVRAVQLGGEQVRAEDARLCAGRCAKDCRLLIVLGSTETGVIASKVLRAADVATQEDLELLACAPDKLVRCVDEHGLGVAPGLPGALVVASEYLASGYLGSSSQRPRFGTRAGLPEFESSDLCCLESDGALRFLGRRDGQLQVRGNSIQPAEIESVLLTQEGVLEAAVVGVAPREGAERELLAVVLSAQAGPDLRPALHEALRSALPTYMWPREIVVLEDLPRTATGKIDRLALAAALADRQPVPRHRVDLGGEVANRLAALWSEAFGCRPENVEANFFASGGSSLDAAVAALLLERDFGFRAGAEFVFRNPTIELQARALSAHAAERIEPPDENGSSVACMAQLGLYFREMAEGGDASITVSTFLLRRGGIDDRHAEAALQILLRRHEALRMRFAPSGGKLTYEIVPELPDAPALVERLPGEFRLPGVPGCEPPARHRPCLMNLRSPPLLRGFLSKLTDGSDLLQLSAHHMAADGGSLRLLAEEFALACQALARGAAVEFEPLGPSFDEFAREQQRSMARAAELERAVELCGELETWLQRCPERRGGAAEDRQELLQEITLGAPLAAPAVGQFALVLAGWTAAQALICGASQLAIGAAVALRRPNLRVPTVGMYANLVPVFVAVDTSRSFGDHVRSTGEALRAAMARSELPFEFALRQSERARRVRSFPFSALLTSVQEPQLAGGFAAVRLPIVRRSRYGPPSAVIRPGPGRLTLEVDVARSDAAVVEKVLRSVAAMLARPDQDFRIDGG